MDGALSAESRRDDLVRLFDRDPSLLQRVDAVTAAFLRDHGAVPSVRLEFGTWHPPLHRASTRQWLGLLVLDGFLGRPMTVGGRPVVEPLGPGDLLRPWDHEASAGLVQPRTPWLVLAPVTLAVLDQRLADVACRTPQFVTELLCRAFRRQTAVAAAVAIADTPDLEDRAAALLAYLADHWGEPHAEGALLPADVDEVLVAMALRVERHESDAVLEALVARGRVRRPDGRIAVRG